MGYHEDMDVRCCRSLRAVTAICMVHVNTQNTAH